MKILTCIIVSISFLFISCSSLYDDSNNYTVIDCPTNLKTVVFSYAKLYRDSDTTYVLGGQDPIRSIAIDCSGLVVRCYNYALENTKYSLQFNDTTAYNMYAYYSVHTNTPEQGDLVFIGESGTDVVSHIAIFDRTENGNVYFIDSTQKDTNNDGIYDVNGVSERYYETTNDKIKGYGIMRIRY